MCAIAGLAGGVLPPEAEPAMLASMERRGPDDRGVYRREGCTLLHARLAVIDPENGRQPMTATRGGVTCTVVYNGELYNTNEVRRELIAAGDFFSTQSDTEVVLRAYLRWGDACLDRFNGIFAFAVWNEATRTLFVARDRCGVKPFFYAETAEGFLFASEIKTLLASGLVRPEVDRDGLADLILLSPGRTPGTGVFRGIRELKPGCCGTVTDGVLRARPYWRLSDRPHTDSLSDTVTKVQELVTDAVERQLVSDVPIGTFLSGGLDSSLISSIANRAMRRQGKKLITFSVTYRDNRKHFRPSHFQPNTDDDHIAVMCDYLGCDHVDVVLDTPDLAAGLHEAVVARDLPGMADVDSSLLLFCKEIKKYVTVALSGECADELFGGYPWFRDPAVRERYGFPWSNNYEYRAGFLLPDAAASLRPRDYVSARYEATCAAAPKGEGLSPEESRMREMSYLNFYWFMQTLLDRKDRMSMYSGLEVRVPFCDHRIAEYLYSVPWSMKDLGGCEKGLLRTAFDGWLPDSILWRKKSPYPKTHNPSYRAAVTDLLIPVLEDKNQPIHAFCDIGRLRALLTDDSAEPWYGQLMTVPQTIAYFYMLNDWMNTYRVRLI